MYSFYYKVFSITIICSVGILVYSNTLFSSFHYDDFYFIVNNTVLKDIHHLQNIWDWWPCRFITFLSFAFNYHFYHWHAVGYHLFNLQIHMAASVLVWWLVLLTFSSPGMNDTFEGEARGKLIGIIALFSGLMFVSHPIQTQAVTFIWQRAASMAALFYLASLCFYVKSRLLVERDDPPGRLYIIYYIFSLMAAVLAMYTKEIAITLPMMIILYEYTFLNRDTLTFSKKKSMCPYLLPYLFIFLLIPATWFFSKGEKVLAGESIVSSISPIQYLMTECRVVATYIRLVFVPVHQNVDYDYSLSKSFLEIPTFVSFLFLAGVVFWARQFFSKYRLVSFGIFWFFLCLLPESSVFPFADVIEEHRLYLPLVGYVLFLAGGFYYLAPKAGTSLMASVLTGIIICFSVLAYQRNGVWKDDITLWNDAVQKSPHRIRPHTNRGLAYYRQGKFNQAIADFNEVLKMSPDNAEAYNNLGVAYAAKGGLAQALAYSKKALEIKPDFAGAQYNQNIINKDAIDGVTRQKP